MSPTSLARHLGIWTGGRVGSWVLCPAAPNLLEGAGVGWVPNPAEEEAGTEEDDDEDDVEEEDEEEDEEGGDEGAQSSIYWDFF
ncbi:uncharacterized protein B0J16DRAFT_385133 [Fusarium flagelliforme]|nr:uncharacterized protein B0J16DRAFT_385133 [Fusarium flagelliforme]KAH7186088.1 hypothetical protein B0J16DRAFT_385133 [Fusarium flagelliforme]